MFITLCECFLGYEPHWGLWETIFAARPQTMKKGVLPDERTPTGHHGLPPYDSMLADHHTGWNLMLTPAEKGVVNRLMKKIGDLYAKGLTAIDLATTWVSRWIQPLQARRTPMWRYSRSDDLMRMSDVELEDSEFDLKMRPLTQEHNNLR